MARRGNESIGEDRAKVRVLFAEVEGNNQSVQEALRTMVSAMSRPVRMVYAKGNNDAPALAQQDNGLESLDDQFEAETPAEESSATEVNGGRKPRGSGRRIDRNAGIAMVPDLNFRPDGHPTLREFFGQKEPSSDMEQILVVIYYMQHMMALSKIGPGHIRTALHDVGKSIPLDLKQTVRNMSGKKAWVKFSDLNDITTATAGENHVRHDMGKNG